MYINKLDDLDDLFNKYNNIYHNTIKMKPADVKSSTFIDSNKNNNNKIQNLTFLIMLEYQNIKSFLQNVTFQFSL